MLIATACSGAASGESDWVPQPNFQQNNEPQPQLPDNGVVPDDPQPSAPGSQAPNPSDPSRGSSPSPSPSAPAFDPAVVATKLNQPTGIVVLPDGTALVGERTTGRILRVQPKPGLAVQPVRTLPGIDGSGDGGLLDLALSPSFSEDGLIYAYITTASDNRVVHFTLTSAASPVITGIPKGPVDNVGRIAFDATGALLTGTGDAGQPDLAQSASSLAGKILRTTDLGQVPSDNPTPGSMIYASGLRTVNGLCIDPRTGNRFATSAGAPGGATNAPDSVKMIKAGSDYGWPIPRSTPGGPSQPVPSTSSGVGGCTIINSHFTVATSTSMSVVVATVNQTATMQSFTNTIQKKYGRLRSVVSAPDGALWLTTSNRDGHGTPTATDDRVIRILSSETGGPNVV